MITIREIIVVEGRDDTAAIRRAVDAETIETHGFGIREETWTLLEKAWESRGLIVFTDPDTAGVQIRRRIMERFPQAREAFLDQEEATAKGDIGIENASPEAILRALLSARSQVSSSESPDLPGPPDPPNPSDPLEPPGPPDPSDPLGPPDSGAPVDPAAKKADAPGFTMKDMDRWGLNGTDGARKRRRLLGRHLGIGEAGAATFLRRLNRFGITREEIEKGLPAPPDEPARIRP